MNRRPGDLVAVDAGAFAVDESALKHLTVLFDRLALAELSALQSYPHLETTEFGKAIPQLVDSGILFQLDRINAADLHDETADLLRRNTDEIIKPVSGIKTKEFIEAAKDEEKLSELKNKSARLKEKLDTGQVDPQTLFEGGPMDPQKLPEIIRRFSTSITRVATTQLRQKENLDAYAVLASELNSLDHDEDEGSNTHDVMKIALTGLPAPSDDVTWKQIVEYRGDPNSHDRFLDLKDWMTETALGKLTPVEIREKLESLLDQYRRHLATHQMNTVTARLDAFMVTNPDVLQKLATVRWGKAESIFSLERRKVALFEEESKSEGSVVALAIETALQL